MVSRYIEFLGHSLVLTSVTVAICVTAAIVVSNARRFSQARVVGYANRVSIVG